MRTIIGREKESALLESLLLTDEAEMVSVIGRRRVGKTFLIDSVYEDNIAFSISGLQHVGEAGQLLNFNLRMRDYFPDWNEPPAKDWLTTFSNLNRLLERTKLEGVKQVVFFDEVPWMSTHKSKFLTGLSFFWNSYASKKNMVVVICGSAASWMIKKILRNTGGLHNRVTKRIRLEPFTLMESMAYLRHRNIRYSQREVMLIYMVMGGVPHYLKEIQTGESVAQAINRICFVQGGLLKDEFISLYPSLFDQSQYHTKIVRALAKTHQGYTREAIISAAGIPNGGRVTAVLEELFESGFITPFPGFGKKKKGRLYRLTDNYSAFYLRFIEPNEAEREGVWQSLSQTQPYKTWCGYAFENVCLYHLPLIKSALGISGVFSSFSTFYHKATEEVPGAQIDLVLDRNDDVINLIEMKFYTKPFIITKAFGEKILQKQAVFEQVNKTRKRTSPVLIASGGVADSAISRSYFDNVFDAEILFPTPT